MSLEENVRIGHFTDLKAKTGCTVVFFPNGATGGIHIAGFASSTRQVDSLSQLHIVERVNAVLVSGGSAFGLNTAEGAMRYLSERGMGSEYASVRIPVVPTAVIFDLFFGESVPPPPDGGYEAMKNCVSIFEASQGSVGAGCGATVGKLFTVRNSTKGGLGIVFDDERNPSIMALCVVNCFGDVVDENGQIIAGARKSESSKEFVNSEKWISENGLPVISGDNTLIAIIVCDAKLSKKECEWVARMSTAGIARAVKPAFTPVDGDVVMCFACGSERADPVRLGVLGARLVESAIRNAVKKADGFGIIPAWKDLIK